MPPLFPLFFVLFSLPIIVWNNAVKASKKHHRYAQTPKGFILKLNLAMFAGAILVPLLAIVGNLMIKIASFLS